MKAQRSHSQEDQSGEYANYERAQNRDPQRYAQERQSRSSQYRTQGMDDSYDRGRQERSQSGRDRWDNPSYRDEQYRDDADLAYPDENRDPYRGSPQRRVAPERGWHEGRYEDEGRYGYAGDSDSSRPYSERGARRSNWQRSSALGEHAGESHRGRGPKGYTRSDDRIKEAVCDQLADDHDIDASEINVDVKDGVVTLKGTVDDRQTKYNVEELVEDCSGVKDVDNQIRINRNRQSKSERESPDAQKTKSS